MRLLHLDSSILGDNSVSRALSKAAAERLVTLNPEAKVSYRDLVADPVGHLTGRYLAGQSSDVQHDQALQEDLALGGRLLEEFLESDTVVIGVAFYNFGIPSQLKAWVDRIAVAGKTFRYTATGPEGLCGGKRIILCIARGGIYAPGSPYAAAEHAESYLRALFSFLGVTALEVIVAEGIAIGPESREKALAEGLAAAEALVA